MIHTTAKVPEQKTFLLHLSYPDIIIWSASCFIVDLAIIFVI